MNVWAELGLEHATAEEAVVRRAYAARLKTIDRTDPEAFGRLRDAYERALALAAQADRDWPEEDDGSPDDGDFDPWSDASDQTFAEDEPIGGPDRAAEWARLDGFAGPFRATAREADPGPALAALKDFFDEDVSLDMTVRETAEDWLFRLAMDGELHPDVLRALAARFDWLAAGSLPARLYPEPLDDLVERLEAYAFLQELERTAAAFTPDAAPGAPERFAAALLGPPQQPPALRWRDRIVQGRGSAWTRHPGLAVALAGAERFLPYLEHRIDPAVVERLRADYVGPTSPGPASPRDRKRGLWVAGVALAAIAGVAAFLFATGRFSSRDAPPLKADAVLAATQSSWVAFGENAGREPVLYFTHLLTYRGALKEIRYGLDGPPDRVFPFPPAPEGTAVAPIVPDMSIYVVAPAATRYATVEIIYKDGRRAGPVTVVRSGDLGEMGFAAPDAPLKR